MFSLDDAPIIVPKRGRSTKVSVSSVLIWVNEDMEELKECSPHWGKHVDVAELNTTAGVVWDEYSHWLNFHPFRDF